MESILEMSRIIADSVPRFVRALLHVFGGKTWDSPRFAELAPLLRERGIQIHGLDARPRLSPASVDCILLSPGEGNVGRVTDLLAKAMPLLQDNGMILVFFPGGKAPVDFLRRLGDLGLREYRARSPRVASRYTTIAAHQKWVDPTGGHGIMAVRDTYDPVRHARALFEAGKPECSLEILEAIPKDMCAEPTSQLVVALEMQLTLLACCAGRSPAQVLELFFRAQQQFYTILNLHPRYHGAYLCQAQFWRVIGDHAMARRLLRSIHHAAPNERIAQAIEAIPEPVMKIAAEGPSAAKPGLSQVLPEWGLDFRPRILVLTHANSDVGLDGLYEGLCRVLGPDQVVEFPWKHYFHGSPIDGKIRHPSNLSFPGEPKSVEALEAELCAGRFDLVLFADTLELTDRDDMLRLVNANPTVPLFVADTQDDGSNALPRVSSYLRRDDIRACFKREMLACADYGPNTYPLPLCYSDARVAGDISGPRPQRIFWAGHRHFGLRRLYLDRLETALRESFDTLYSQEEYVRALEHSQIGIDIFGLGFDTVRYWEVPAHGCMLLAERRPTRIPHDFRDGESAVFFDDLPDLREKLQYYLAHSEEARAIAVAGYHHLCARHTASARARQFLGHVQQILRPNA